MIFEEVTAGVTPTSTDVVVVALRVDTPCGSKACRIVYLTVNTIRIGCTSSRFYSRTGRVKAVFSNVKPQPTDEQAFAVSEYLVIGKRLVTLQCKKGEPSILQLRVTPAPDTAIS